jgi:potassium/hydrogen antiporter
MINSGTLAISLIITFGIYLVRAIHLKLMNLPLLPLLFIAPRGLITILLFLSIPVTMTIPLFGQSMVIQVILLTVLVMMAGTIFFNPKPEKNDFCDYSGTE